MATARESTRDRLLDAAEALLVEAGPRGLTLDAVAAAARVSKGGLLYHFRSKDALVEGLVMHKILSTAPVRRADTRAIVDRAVGPDPSFPRRPRSRS